MVIATVMTVLLTTAMLHPGERGDGGAGGVAGGEGGGGDSGGNGGSEGGGSAGGGLAGVGTSPDPSPDPTWPDPSSARDSFTARVTCSLKVSSTVLTGRHRLLPEFLHASKSA